MSNALQLVSQMLAVVLLTESLHLLSRGWIYLSELGIADEAFYLDLYQRKPFSLFFTFSSPLAVRCIIVIYQCVLVGIVVSPNFMVGWIFVSLVLFSRITRNPIVSHHGDRLALLGSLALSFYILGLSENLILISIKVICSSMYFYTAINKVMDIEWREGNAVFQVLWDCLPRRQTIPFPGIVSNRLVSALLTWAIIIFQLLIALFIWVEGYQWIALLLAVILHLSIELFFSVKAFQFVAISLMLVCVAN